MRVRGCRQWHTWCFACGSCGCVLQGEYMGREGVPYCERDYQRLYGVRCAYCQRYISGKVLQVLSPWPSLPLATLVSKGLPTDASLLIY